MPALVLSRIIDIHDIGVADTGCGLGFRDESTDKILIIIVFLTKDLNGYIIVLIEASCLIDVRHSTGTDMVHDLITAAQYCSGLYH